MRTSKLFAKFVALLLSVAMALPGMSNTVFAASETRPSTHGEIIAFASLEDAVVMQTVPLGTNIAALNLPGMLMATVCFEFSLDVVEEAKKEAKILIRDSSEETVAEIEAWEAS